MRRTPRIVIPLTLLALGAAAALGGTNASLAAPRAGSSALTASQLQAQRLGLQVGPKGSVLAAKKTRVRAANPYLATVPANVRPDYAGWQRLMAAKAAKRAISPTLSAARRAATGGAKLASPLLHDEQEPRDLAGSNDTVADAERIGGFGTGTGENNRLRILGTIADTTTSAGPLDVPPAEDNGQLSIATPTGIDGAGGITTTSTLGDGPHGTQSGDGTNDFDFYTLKTTKGERITVDTAGSEVDTVVAIYDVNGTPLAADDDGGGELGGASLLTYIAPANGTYYVLVAGYSLDPLPADPRDSGSGSGGAKEGAYALKLTAGPFDSDVYGLHLRKGDVLGATVSGAPSLTVYKPNGAQRVGAPAVDASAIYPPNSPLPGGGDTTLAYVAEESGWYGLRVDGDPGRYDATVEVYRPGSETDTSTRVQTVFLDFDGARVNTGIFGGPGVRTLSPFSAFIAKWGLSRTQEGELIDRITAVVRQNIQRYLAAHGLNDKLAVKVVNSRHSADLFGQTNVSRVIVGGTIAQSGIETIGISQFIDPGNYGHEDTALVLLDVLSDSDPTNEASLNYYLKPGSDRARFVTCAIGNVVSHEIGHYLGNFHTDNSDTTHTLMDAGGGFFGQNLYGVGPDGVGGTADDEDIDFKTDTYSPQEPFTGRENTLNVSAWAFVKGPRVP